jgi:hypothetical protein
MGEIQSNMVFYLMFYLDKQIRSLLFKLMYILKS